MFDANNISANLTKCVISGFLQADSKITLTPEITETNRNVICYNLPIIHKNILSLKLAEKIRMFSLGRKNVVLIKEWTAKQSFSDVFGSRDPRVWKHVSLTRPHSPSRFGHWLKTFRSNVDRRWRSLKGVQWKKQRVMNRCLC